MPLPPAASFVLTLTPANQDLKITLPGGPELAPNLPFADMPSPLDVGRGLLAQVNTALAPLTPVFNLIDIGIAVFEFAKSVPSLNPVTIVNKTKALALAVDKILRLIPQLSVPIMILGIIDAILAMLDGLVGELQLLVAQANAIAASRAAATSLGNVEMTAALNIADANVTAQITSMNKGLAPLNRLVALVNLIIGLVPGLPALPSFADLSSSPSAALEELEDVIQTLQDIRGLIPIG